MYRCGNKISERPLHCRPTQGLLPPGSPCEALGITTGGFVCSESASAQPIISLLTEGLFSAFKSDAQTRYDSCVANPSPGRDPSCCSKITDDANVENFCPIVCTGPNDDEELLLPTLVRHQSYFYCYQDCLSCDYTGHTDSYCASNSGKIGDEFARQGETSCCYLTSTAGYGACCIHGACMETTEELCSTGTFKGVGSTCSTASCDLGACCLPSGTCVEETSALCTGIFLGTNVNCNNAQCLSCPAFAEFGACCTNSGGCVSTSQENCGSAVGSFRGKGTNCVTSSCPAVSTSPSPCPSVAPSPCPSIAPSPCPSVAPSPCPSCPSPSPCPSLPPTPSPSTCPVYPSASPCPSSTPCPTCPSPSPCPAPSTCPSPSPCPAPSTCPSPTPCPNCPVCPSPTPCPNCPTCPSPSPVPSPSSCPIVPTKGACCTSSGDCVISTSADCSTARGTWVNVGFCDSSVCPAPIGACCDNNGGCRLSSPSSCQGTYQGGGTRCIAGQCGAAVGACCLQDGKCIVAPQKSCLAVNGSFNEGVSDCSQLPGSCAESRGGCCRVDGTCVRAFQRNCNGKWFGPETYCSDFVCTATLGGCCLSDGTCIKTTESGCTNTISPIGSTAFYLGDGTDCQFNGDSFCAVIGVGACCRRDGTCVQRTAAECAGINEAVFQGVNSKCSPGQCGPGVGSCCLSDGDCVIATRDSCQSGENAGRKWNGFNTECTRNGCPEPRGACCGSAGQCSRITEKECNEKAKSFVWQGANTRCIAGQCGVTSCPKVSFGENVIYFETDRISETTGTVRNKNIAKEALQNIEHYGTQAPQNNKQVALVSAENGRHTSIFVLTSPGYKANSTSIERELFTRLDFYAMLRWPPYSRKQYSIEVRNFKRSAWELIETNKDTDGLSANEWREVRVNGIDSIIERTQTKDYISEGTNEIRIRFSALKASSANEPNPCFIDYVSVETHYVQLSFV